jgi:hypothetical protein
MIKATIRQDAEKENKPSMLDYALTYARQGWAVFPLNGKVPFKGTRGFLDATTDEKQIRAWWKKYPNANIGVATGQTSGIYVADVDNKNDKDGEASLRTFVNGHNALPETLESRTPSGGRHIVFKMPAGIQIPSGTDVHGVGLDVRANGGYIVAPPSVIGGKSYEWINNNPIAALPDLFLPKPRGRRPPRRNVSPTNIAIVKSALDAIAENYDKAVVGDSAYSYENWRNVGFGLHHESDGADEWLELWIDWSRGSDKFNLVECQKVWAKFKDDEGSITIGTVFMMARLSGWIRPKEIIQEWWPDDIITSANALLERDIAPPIWLIEGLMFEESFVQIAGWRGIGKTQLTLSLALALAKGEKFLYWDIPSPVRVLYIDGEMGARDFREMLRFLSKGTGCGMLEVMLSSDFYKYVGAENGSLAINNVLHQQQILEQLDRLSAMDRRPEVIILDNISSLTTGVDENDNSGQDTLRDFMVGLRHKGYTIIQVHHTGKGGAQRGASRREDQLNLSIILDVPEVPDSQGRAKFIFKNTKVRGMKMPKPDSFEAVLGEDEHGYGAWLLNSAPSKEKEKWIQILKFINDKKPSTQLEIAGHFQSAISTINQHIKKARAKGLLGEGLDVTPNGKSYLDAAYREVKMEDVSGLF